MGRGGPLCRARIGDAGWVRDAGGVGDSRRVGVWRGLLRALLDLGCEVALETAGSHDLAPVPREVVKIVDRKTPGSGEGHRWLESNLAWLVPGQDELKFVLCDAADYAWARAWCAERRVWDRVEVLFSPAWGRLDPAWLAERVLEDGLPVRLQLQLHKLIWGAEARGV